MFGKDRRSGSRLLAVLGAIAVMTGFLTVGITPTSNAEEGLPPGGDTPVASYVEDGPSTLLAPASTSSEEWQRQSVTPDANGWYSSLVLDSQGRPHVAFRGDGTNQGTIRYAWYDGTTKTWRGAKSATGPDVVATGSTGYLLSMALDSAGHPHIAFTTGQTVRYASWDGSSWATTTAATVTGTGHFAASPSLAIGPSGTHLSYLDATSGDTRTARGTVMYTEPGGAPTQVSPAGATAYGYTSLALDSAGEPHIAYYDVTGSSSEQVSYASRTGTMWGVPEAAADVATGTAFGSGLSLAMANDSPRIAFSATYPAGSTKPGSWLQHVARDGGVWHPAQYLASGVTVGSTGTISMAVDSNDIAHIAYYTNVVRYGTLAGQSWTSAQLGDTGLLSYYPSLALSSDGKPRVTYFKRTDLPLSTHGPLVYAHLNKLTANDDSLAVQEDATEATSLDVLANDTQYAYSGPLTVTIQTQPTHGTADVVGEKVSYQPTEANYNGPDSLVYQVCDSNGDPELCATATVSIDVQPVNDKPVCRDVTLTTSEDTPGTTKPDCTDADGDALSYAIVQPPTKGLAGATATDLTFDPDGKYDGLNAGESNTTDGSFTYRASDGTAESDPATAAVTVTGVNDAPAFGALPTNAGGQYSDPIDGDTTKDGTQPLTITASDVDNPATGLTISVCAGGPALPADLGLTDNRDGTATITGLLSVKAGTYKPCLVVSDGTDQTMATLTITVTAEDATVTNLEPTFVEIDGTDGDKDLVPLTGSFVEANDGHPSSALSSYQDAYGGTDVKLTVDPVGTAGSPANCTDSGVPTPSGSAIGCSVANMLADGYEVDAGISGGWFTGSGIGTLAVFDPANGFATGGGEFTWASAPSPWTGAKVNFAFTGKKLNKNIKGSVLTVIHTATGPYVIKTNSFTGLSNVRGGTSPEWWYTTMTGKATYGVPDGQVNPYCTPGVLKCGNFTVIMYAEDHGEPGAGIDTYKVKLIAPNGKALFDMPLQTISGGNVEVPHVTTK